VLRAERPEGDREAVGHAIERLRTLVSAEADAEVPRSVAMARRNSLTHVAALRDALSNRKRVRIRYHKGAATEADERTVCPFSFAVEKGVWYLIAYCERSEGVRIFRTDRIEHIALLPESFDHPDDFDAETLLAEGTAFAGPAPETLRVRYSARAARWIGERESGKRLSDGALEVDYPLGDTDWAVRHVLQYGPDAQVIAPAEVRDAVVERLQAALR
jgi:proteasome accessory factor C